MPSDDLQPEADLKKKKKKPSPCGGNNHTHWTQKVFKALQGTKATVIQQSNKVISVPLVSTVANSVILRVRKGTYKMLFGVTGVRNKNGRGAILIWLLYPVPKARTDSNPVFFFVCTLGPAVAG